MNLTGSMADSENARPTSSVAISVWPLAVAGALLGLALARNYLSAASRGAGVEGPFDVGKRNEHSQDTLHDVERGREATTPSEIPPRGWKDILLRVHQNISKHRVLALRPA